MSGESLSERIHFIRCGCSSSPEWPDREAAAVACHYDSLITAVADAARLRSLATLYDNPLNRDQEHTFTGHALAEMLRGSGE